MTSTAGGSATHSVAAKADVPVAAGAAPEAATIGEVLAARRRVQGVSPPMSVAEAVAAAVAEILTLLRTNNSSVFRNVSYNQQSNTYQAEIHPRAMVRSIASWLL